jgi:hypothetical protein
MGWFYFRLRVKRTWKDAHSAGALGTATVITWTAVKETEPIFETCVPLCWIPRRWTTSKKLSANRASEVYISLRLDTTAVHNSRWLPINYQLISAWLRVSAARAAIFRPAINENKYLNERTIYCEWLLLDCNWLCSEIRFFKEAIPLCENLEVYIRLGLDTTAVHNSRWLPINYQLISA